jgi:hypothetical protein
MAPGAGIDRGGLSFLGMKSQEGPFPPAATSVSEAADVARRVGRGAHTPRSGRSLRPSRPSLTACPLRFAILASLAPRARLSGHGHPSRNHPDSAGTHGRSDLNARPGCTSPRTFMHRRQRHPIRKPEAPATGMRTASLHASSSPPNQEARSASDGNPDGRHGSAALKVRPDAARSGNSYPVSRYDQAVAGEAGISPQSSRPLLHGLLTPYLPAWGLSGRWTYRPDRAGGRQQFRQHLLERRVGIGRPGGGRAVVPRIPRRLRRRAGRRLGEPDVDRRWIVGLGEAAVVRLVRVVDPGDEYRDRFHSWFRQRVVRIVRQHHQGGLGPPRPRPHDSWPGPRCRSNRSESVASNPEIGLRGRARYGASIIVVVRAHRAAGGNRDEQQCRQPAEDRSRFRNTRPAMAMSNAHGAALRANAARQRLLPPPRPTPGFDPARPESSENPDRRRRSARPYPPPARGGRPMRSMRSFMSSQTSRLAAGFRRRYEGW